MRWVKINKNKKINFEFKKILNKDFSISMPGYNSMDVDYFLDELITDFKNNNNFLDQLNFENETNLKIIDDLQIKITNLEMSNQLLREQLRDLDNKGYNNLEILKRLSNLEEAINEKNNEIMKNITEK